LIGTIVRKEVHENLLTFRFLFGTLILILLVSAITLVNLKSFGERQREYGFAVRQAEADLKATRVYGQIRAAAVRPPEVLSVLAQGVNGKLGNAVGISIKDVPTIAKRFSEENPLLGIFPSLDLTLVYKIVVSLLALLFGFDAVCGEKERGLLRLLLAQGASRFKIVLGKYLGHAATLGLAVILSLGAAALLIVLFGPGPGAFSWLRLLLFGATALLYLALFLAVGLLVSSLAHRPSQSLVYCLLIWVFLVIVWPNLSSFAAAAIRPVPPEKALDARIQAIREPYDRRIDEWTKANRPKQGWSISGWTGHEDVVLLSGDKGAVEYFREFVAFLEPLLRERADEIWSARRDYDRDLDGQRRLASSLGKISPAGLFDEAAEVAAGSDLAGYEGFIAQAALYREAVFRYLRAKDAVHSLRYFTVMKEKDLLPLEEYRKRNEPRKPDGSFYEETDYPPLALDDFPRFSYRAERAAEVLPRALLSLLILGAINLGLFFGAAAAFARYDVR
jgi:ABC-2 type transport system permease protein